MTEKRFKLSKPNGAYLIDDDRPYAHWINDDDKIIDLLNALHDENVKLQARNKYLAMKIQRERNSTQKQYAKWEKEAETKIKELSEENEQLKASLYAEKTNTAEVINEYAKQFKRHSSQFSFMIDLAEDLGIDVSKLEALDD